MKKQTKARRDSATPAKSDGDFEAERTSPVKWRWIGWSALIGLPLLLVGGVFADWWISVPASRKAEYVGGKSCIKCHQGQYKQWHGSHHDLAMDLATPDKVLGDFDDAELTHYGVTSKMRTRDGKYFVETEGPDGEMAEFEVKYVFGVEPMQQYMVELQRGDDLKEDEIGTVQVLPVTWDTERKEWFFVNPPDVPEPADPHARILSPRDRLHWTGDAANWNRMCADCHSTNLKKNFDDTTGHYHTTFTDIDVNCESCHGPGSIHIELANAKSLFWDRKRGYGLAKLKGESNHAEVETCARCHVRRQQIVAGDYVPGEPFLDYFGPAVINPADSYHGRLYHADGQIRDEVYVTGSFLQSKMYHKNIRCTDCHNPHTTKLKHEGNKLCTSCHTHPAGKYDTPAHHHHKEGSKGASCVECHMPHTTYMEVDPRRDHSIRIPRPDISVATGSPNACTGCHLDANKLSGAARDELTQGFTRQPLENYARWLESRNRAKDKPVREEIADELARLDEWALEKTREWYGGKIEDRPHWAFAIDAAWKAIADPDDEELREDAEAKLIEVVQTNALPAFARASAVLHLRAFANDQVLRVINTALTDDEALVRHAALGFYEPALTELRQSDRDIQDEMEQLDEVIKIARKEKRQPLTIQHLQSRRAQMQEVRDQIHKRTAEYVAAPGELLDDPVRLVRIEAARVLALVPQRLLNAEQQAARAAAVEEFKAAMQSENDHALSHNALGVLHERLAEADEDLDLAVKAYETAIRIQPKQVGPRSNLAELLSRRAGRTDDAAQAQRWHLQVRELRLAEAEEYGFNADLMPEDATLRLRHAQALHLAGREMAAVNAMKQAVETAPDRGDIRFQLALMHERHEQTDEAVAALQEVIRRHPKDDQLLFSSGQVLARLGKQEQGIAVLNAAAKLAPQREEIWYHLAVLHRERAEWDEALEAIRTLVNLAPGNPRFQRMLEQTLVQSQQEM